MNPSNEERIKKRVVRILKANRDAFAATVAADENRRRKIFDSDEEIDFLVKETDLAFALAIARTRNHPAINLFRVTRETTHGAPIDSFAGIVLSGILVSNESDASSNIEALFINSPEKTDEQAKTEVLSAREFPDLFGGKDSFKDCAAICNQILYLADDRMIKAILNVTDVARRDDNALNCPDFCEDGIIAGTVRRALRDGAEMDVVKSHYDFEQEALAAIFGGGIPNRQLPQ